MASYDIAGRIGSWIADVIDAETALSGEECGWSVTALPYPGDVIAWTLILTMRSPFLGAGDLAASATVQANVPSEEGVRHFAETSLGKLRAEFEQAKRAGLSARNGHPKPAS